jgi:hypothetical protein
MKKLLSYVAIIVMSMAVFCGCRSEKEVNKLASTVGSETVSLYYSPEGKVTVRAWGQGSSKAAAIESAMVKAVYDVLFTGIKTGAGSETLRYPLISEVNAYERYSNYFQPFFSSGGEYTRFVWEDNTTGQLQKATGDNISGYGVVLVVDVAALKAQLKRDNVIR